MNIKRQSYFNFKKISAIVTGGFAVFAMFFGAGNLVFPLLAGKYALSSFFSAFLGLCLTGIVVPFLGLVGILLYNGCYQEFFNRYGKKIGFAIVFLCYFFWGPMARSLVVLQWLMEALAS